MDVEAAADGLASERPPCNFITAREDAIFDVSVDTESPSDIYLMEVMSRKQLACQSTKARHGVLPPKTP